LTRGVSAGRKGPKKKDGDAIKGPIDIDLYIGIVEKQQKHLESLSNLSDFLKKPHQL
jgi:hypothetical protein